MSFTSLSFLAFLTVTAIVYYLIPKRFQWVVLLIASYAFYLFSGIAQVVFIIATTLITFFAGRLMQKVRDKYRADAETHKSESREFLQKLKDNASSKIHRIQVLSVLTNLGILAVVKYLNFLIGNVNSLFSLFEYDASIPLINIIVPLGISFYTFQSMGYLIDIGRGKYEAETHIGKFALFVSFFPSIIQGPINRYSDLGKQLREPHSFEYTNVKFGAQLILWGFFKKMIIADRLSPVVSQIFSDEYTQYPGSVFLFGILMYAAQIYGDFSGGIDIARGAAQILGINLPQNFERPYFSRSVAEYWRRWHITLGNWMRDYVFYPIMLSKPVTKVSKFLRSKGKNKLAKLVPSVVTPFVVFFLIGIWHGASWKYVAFGLYNATIVAGSVALADPFKKCLKGLRINTDAFSWKLFQIVRTFLVLCVSKLLVRAPGLGAAVDMLKSMFTDFEPLYLLQNVGEFGMSQFARWVVGLALVVLFVVSLLQENGMKIRESLARQNIAFRWSIYILLVVAILLFGVYGPGYNAVDFIYQAY